MKAAMTEMPAVAMNILNFNSLRDTCDCLDSVRNINYPRCEVWVVDNGSSGDDAAVLEKRYGKWIKLIKNKTNDGFAGGNNLVLRELIKSDSFNYFLLLNNDTTVKPDLVSELVKIAESDPRIGLVGPKTYASGLNNILQTVWFTVDMYTGRARLTGLMSPDLGQYDTTLPVDFIQGSCMLIKNDLVKQIGLLDEDYFCYWEDTDYCFRARKAGYRVFFAHRAVIFHRNKISTRLKPWYRTIFNNKRDVLNELETYLVTRNKFRFMKKNGTRFQFTCFVLYFTLVRTWYRSGVILCYYRQPGVLRAFWRGVREGVFSRGTATRG